MPSSIKFDNVEILSTTYIPRYVKHESAPERELGLLDLVREDGSILISEKYGAKRITLIGYLTAANQSALETAIDNFKELFSRKEKNLDVEWAGGTRRYVATCIRHNFDRDHFHLLFVPWTAEFIVIKGIGEASSETLLIDTAIFGTQNIEIESMTFAGSAEPKPRIRIRTNCTADVKGIRIENTDVKEKIIFTRTEGIGGGLWFQVDARLKKITWDGDDVNFYGLIPGWKVGVNNYEIECGDIINQEFNPSAMNDYLIFFADLWAAQSFTVPYKDVTFQGISLYLKKDGTPPNAVIARIENDTDGKPAGGAAIASFTIPEASIGSDYAWIHANSASSFTLEANKKYWIVVKTTAGEVGHHYYIGKAQGIQATYKRGNGAYTIDAGVNWNDEPDKDYLFRLFYGGKKETATANYDVFYFERYL